MFSGACSHQHAVRTFLSLEYGVDSIPHCGVIEDTELLLAWVTLERGSTMRLVVGLLICASCLVPLMSFSNILKEREHAK